MNSRALATWCALTAVPVGCGGDLRDDSVAGADPQTQPPPGDSSTAAAGATDDGGFNDPSTTSDDAAESDSGAAPIYDVGGGGGDGLPPADGCHKIDFLFVVDNSLSMAGHQSALISSFGPFIDTIATEVQANDFHILVTDSDAGDDLLTCGTCLFCGDYCDHTDAFDACETTLGAGEIQPYGGGASNAICGVPAPHRYLTSAVPTAQLKATFSCMAQVGTAGSGQELPMSAMVQAVTSQSTPAGCNAGFRRADAILVVTIISDDPLQAQTDDNASSVGSPEQWYDGVLAAVSDDPASLVMLGVVQDGEHAVPRFTEFFELFGDRALLGDINAPAYDAFFEEAVGLIDTTCDEFEPEG